MKRDEAAEPETERGSNHLLSHSPYSFTTGLTMELGVLRALRELLGAHLLTLTALVCDSYH